MDNQSTDSNVRFDGSNFFQLQGYDVSLNSNSWTLNDGTVIVSNRIDLTQGITTLIWTNQTNKKFLITWMGVILPIPVEGFVSEPTSATLAGMDISSAALFDNVNTVSPSLNGLSIFSTTTVNTTSLENGDTIVFDNTAGPAVADTYIANFIIKGFYF